MGWIRVSASVSLGVLVAVVTACSLSPGSPTETIPTRAVLPTAEATEPPAAATSLIAATPADATPEATADTTALMSTRVPDAATAESTGSAELYLIREPAPGPACSISPTGGAGVNIRREPGKDSEAIGGLLRGAWVLAKGLDKSGVWFQISAPNTPVDGGWITSQNVTIRGVCNCSPGTTCETGAPIVTPTP